MKAEVLQVTSIRLPKSLLERVDCVAERLQGSEYSAGASMDRSSALRLAIIRGLASLEREIARKEDGNQRKIR